MERSKQRSGCDLGCEGADGGWPSCRRRHRRCSAASDLGPALLCCSAAQADSGAPTIFDKIISKEIPAQVGTGCQGDGQVREPAAHQVPALALLLTCPVAPDAHPSAASLAPGCRSSTRMSRRWRSGTSTPRAPCTSWWVGGPPAGACGAPQLLSAGAWAACMRHTRCALWHWTVECTPLRQQPLLSGVLAPGPTLPFILLAPGPTRR